jgi:hypothetical protein
MDEGRKRVLAIVAGISAATDSGIKKDDSEQGHLTITEVKMVSDSCQR